MCGYLGRRPQRDVATRLEARDDAARLDRVRDQRRLDVAVLHDHVRAFVEIARVQLPHVGDVGAEILVNERCALLGGRLDVDDHPERLVLDVDELGRVDGVCARVCEHDRDAVTLIVHFRDGEREVLGVLHVLRHRPGARHRRLPVVTQIGAGEDGDDPRRRFCCGGIDRRDPRVRVGAADDDHHDRARNVEVVDVRPPAAEQRVVLLALERGADAPRLRGAHDGAPATSTIASTMLW